VRLVSLQLSTSWHLKAEDGSYNCDKTHAYIRLQKNPSDKIRAIWLGIRTVSSGGVCQERHHAKTTRRCL
jgi:hypothetical protein